MAGTAASHRVAIVGGGFAGLYACRSLRDAPVHLYYLIGFDNRLVVMTQWAWAYFTRRGGAQLITGEPLRPELKEPIRQPDDTAGPERR